MPSKYSPVLVVARNSRMRERIEATLAKRGIQALGTSSPSKGLKTLRLLKPQVMLVEYADKGIPGFIDVAKEENPDLRVILIEDDSPKKPPLRNEVVQALMADGYRRLPSDLEYLTSDVERMADTSVMAEEEIEVPPAFGPTEPVEAPVEEPVVDAPTVEELVAEELAPVEEAPVAPEDVVVNREDEDHKGYVPFSSPEPTLDELEPDHFIDEEESEGYMPLSSPEPGLEDLITNPDYEEMDEPGLSDLDDEEQYEDEDEDEDEDAGAWAADPYELLQGAYPREVYEDNPESLYYEGPRTRVDPDFDPTTYGLEDEEDEDEEEPSDDEDYLDDEEDPESAWGADPYKAPSFDRETDLSSDGDDDDDDYTRSMANEFGPLELGDDDFEEITPAGKDYSDFGPSKADLFFSPSEVDVREQRRQTLKRLDPGRRKYSPEERLNYIMYGRFGGGANAEMRFRSPQFPRQVYMEPGYDERPVNIPGVPLGRVTVPSGSDYSDFDIPMEEPVEYGDFDIPMEEPVDYASGLDVPPRSSVPYIEDEEPGRFMESPFAHEMPRQRRQQPATRVIHRDTPPPLRGGPGSGYPTLPSFPPSGGYLSEQMAEKRKPRSPALPPFPPSSYWQELDARRKRPAPYSGPASARPDLIGDLGNFNVMARRASWMAPVRKAARQMPRAAQKTKKSPETLYQRKEKPTAVFVGEGNKPERPMTLKQAFSCLDLKLQARSGDYIIGCVSCDGDLFKKLGSHQVNHLIRTYVQAQVNAQPGSPFGGMGRVHVTKIDPKKKCAYFRFASHYQGHLPYKTFENDD